ncbi:SDR family oxidoreductase [Novosphingobium resinovorum]|uniref:SDR family oxidoreductase n=1 Tax=Novosphingobium resinovorum TaxID=158500 RepID=UPI002ED40A1D|nr:SDR family oxidoreductase [Novosphingobium resinovorum]
MRRLEGRVTVITGASGGLGEATARRFAREGARLVLGDIREEAGQALAQELDAAFLPCDVTCEGDVAALVDRAVALHGRLDCMVNNAGQLGAVGRVEEIAAQSWRDTLAVLLDSVFYGMKHAARVMRPHGAGAILSTSSAAGIAPLGPHAYTAAKHAVVGLTRSVASELAADGIRVNAIAPGNVPTRMTELAYGDAAAMRKSAEARNPLRRVVEGDEVAAAFAYLASDDAINVTGQVIAVDAGLVECRLASDYYARAASYFDAEGKRGI